jgi:hypothetical protein
MLLISNKGNTTGTNILLQNTPGYIDSTIKQGYNVKIDLWYQNNKCYLGSDGPKIEIEWKWLIDNASSLWVKCASTETFSFLLENGKALNFFYNDQDPIAITSKGIAWSFNNNFTKNTIVYDTDQIDGVLGVCSDYVSKWSKQVAICFYGESGLPKSKIIKNHKQNMIDVLESMGYHIEYYGVKALIPNENDLEYNKIYNFKELRSYLKDSSKTVDDVSELHIKSIYEMIGTHPYDTAFFIKWDQILTNEEIELHITN